MTALLVSIIFGVPIAGFGWLIWDAVTSLKDNRPYDWTKDGL